MKHRNTKMFLLFVNMEQLLFLIENITTKNISIITIQARKINIKQLI